MKKGGHVKTGTLSRAFYLSKPPGISGLFLCFKDDYLVFKQQSSKFFPLPISKMMKILFLTTIIAFTPISEAGFRCRFIGEWWCSATCVLTGQTSGTCNEQQDCICSEKEIDLTGDLESIPKTIESKMKEFAQQIGNWTISEEVKQLIPSRCKIGKEFCKSTCNTIGRRDGTCNEANADCDCSSEIVTPREWALCVEDAICRIDCQRKGYAVGKCEGDFNWTCNCISKKGDVVANNSEKDVEFLEVSDFGPEEPNL